MATIGLKDLYYALITENSSGEETYGTPALIAPAISADLTINRNKAQLPADDKIEDEINEFVDGTLTLGVSAITSAVAAALTGAAVDNNGCLVDTDEDNAPYVAVGFRAKTSKGGNYRYIWLYRVKFSPAKETFNTKGQTTSFNTPTIEGTILLRNKADSRGQHPWRYSVTEGESNASATVISNWFSSVPEPSFTAQSSST